MKTNILTIILIILFFQISYSQEFPENGKSIAEYSPTESVLMHYNFDASLWPVYRSLIFEIQFVAKVILIVNNQAEQDSMVILLNQSYIPTNNIEFIHLSVYNIDIGNFGPVCTLDNNELSFIDFKNYDDYGSDADFPEQLAQYLNVNCYSTSFIFDRCNFLTDNSRNIFAVNHLYSNNPDFYAEQIMYELSMYFGLHSISIFKPQWNELNGHILNQIKLLNDTTVVISTVDDTIQNYDSLQINYLNFSAFTSPSGNPYTVEKIPAADNWKSYTRSLIVNHNIFVPEYNHPYDFLAKTIYHELLPDYNIAGINCDTLIAMNLGIQDIVCQLPDLVSLFGVTQQSWQNASISVFPNPAEKSFTIEFEITKNQNVCVNIKDIYGNNIYNVTKNKFCKGKYSFYCDIKLNSGIYFIEFDNEDEIISKKLIIY